MVKFKSIKWGTLLSLLKCCLIGVVTTLIGIVIFAVTLKFANLSSLVISYVNDLIKIFSIFVMLTCIRKQNNERLFIKSLIAGMLYAIFTFLIFSILNGSFEFNLSFLYDVLFSILVSAIISVIINVLTRKTVG